jgi:transposase
MTSDAQWKLIEPLLPPTRPGRRREKHSRRAVVDAILYVLRTGCAWRQLPVNIPPWATVYWYFARWEQAKVTARVPGPEPAGLPASLGFEFQHLQGGQTAAGF